MKRVRSRLVVLPLLVLSLHIDRVLAAGPIRVDLVTIVTTESLWVGINTQLVSMDVKPGKIGVNTEYLTEEGGQTKWIGKNTQYLTELVHIAINTVNGAPAARVTSFPELQIIGPLDAEGIPTGPFTVTLAPSLAARILELVKRLCTTKTETGGGCSEEFIRRVQALLMSGDGVLISRDPQALEVVQTLAAPVAALIAMAWARLSTNREILLSVEITHDDNGNVLFTTVTSGLVMTHTRYNKQTQAITDLPPENTSQPDEDDACWLYYGVDVVNSLEEEVSVKRRSLASAESHINHDEDLDQLARRFQGAVAGRTPYHEPPAHAHSKRAAKKPKPPKAPKGPGGINQVPRHKFINQIGHCATKPTLDSIIRAEVHPGPTTAMMPFSLDNDGAVNHGIDPNMWWFVPDQTPTELNDPCVIAKLTKRGKKDENSADTSENNFPLPYAQYSSKVKQLTVDHIYETSTLQDFFNSQLKTPDDPECKSFVEMFDKPDSKLGAGKVSRFHSLWQQNSNPRPSNWAFAGADGRINAFKGTLLNPGLVNWPSLKPVIGAEAADNFDRLFQTWNNAGLSFDFIEEANMLVYFSQRNSAVYSAFLDFDLIQRCEKNKKYGTEYTSWAPAYKKYMINLLRSNQELIQAKIKEIRAAID